MRASIFALLFLVACSPHPQPRPPTPERDAAAYDEREIGDAPDDCARACGNVRRLQCPAGYSVDGGASCSDMCRRVVASRLTQLDVTCAVSAPNSDALRACPGWGCK